MSGSGPAPRIAADAADLSEVDGDLLLAVRQARAAHRDLGQRLARLETLLGARSE